MNSIHSNGIFLRQQQQQQQKNLKPNQASEQKEQTFKVQTIDDKSTQYKWHFFRAHQTDLRIWEHNK